MSFFATRTGNAKLQASGCDLSHIALAPDESLILYDTMVQVAEEFELEKTELNRLHPDTYFQSFIPQLAAREWGVKLKELLQKWFVTERKNALSVFTKLIVCIDEPEDMDHVDFNTVS